MIFFLDSDDMVIKLSASEGCRMAADGTPQGADVPSGNIRLPQFLWKSTEAYIVSSEAPNNLPFHAGMAKAIRFTLKQLFPQLMKAAPWSSWSSNRERDKEFKGDLMDIPHVERMYYTRDTD